jgi:RHS repeat-associated protein
MGDGSWTVYVGGIYEKHSDGTYVKYYSALGRRIAMRTDSEGSAGVVNYVLADHLGSSTTITDAWGGDLRTMKYYPYGAERSVSGDMITDKLFTGQQKEPEGVSTLGLYNYGARFYSTLVGRFLSPDPVIAKLGDPQVLNRYSYVRNNPLIFVDPTGLQMIPPEPPPTPPLTPTPVILPIVEELIPETDPGTPVPGPSVEARRADCAAHLTACLTYAYAAKYGGATPWDLVIVMGANQSLPGSMESFRGYGVEFLKQKGPGGCAVQAAQCWEDFKKVAAVSPTAANNVFGIMFIESAPNLADFGLDMLISAIEFVSGGLLATADRGERPLRDVLENGPRDMEHIVGVIGFSEGAGTVSKFFAENPTYGRVPFFLIEPAGVDPGYRSSVSRLDNFAGSYPWGSGSGLGFLHHGTHDKVSGVDVMYCLTHVGAEGCR